YRGWRDKWIALVDTEIKQHFEETRAKAGLAYQQYRTEHARHSATAEDLLPEPESLREARARFESAAAAAFQADPANVEKFGLPVAHPVRMLGKPPESWRDVAEPIYGVLLSALVAGEGLWKLMPSPEELGIKKGIPSTTKLRIKEYMYRATYSLI